MMFYFLAALIVAVIGIAPLFVARKFTAAAFIGTAASLILWFLLWLGTPSTVYPYGGWIGVSVLILWGICPVIDNLDTFGEYNARIKYRTAVFFLVGALAYFSSCTTGMPFFRAHTYAAMMGTVEVSEWTKDVQPKDPRHMIMVSAQNAVFLAKKAISQGGAIGSQFNLNIQAAELQRVRGELVYVFPLDFQGFAVWQSSSGVPAYIIVYAEDPARAPLLVELPVERHLRYTPDAFFGDNLERHLRYNGFINKGLTDQHLELDDNGNPYWVVSTFAPTINWSGEKITGVATVDPVSGAIALYSVEDAPAWIDRILPANFAKTYLEWRGEYSNGWWNSFWTQMGITEPEEPILIYGEGDRAEYVAGMTSNNKKDDSLVGLMYVDSRTGKTKYYEVKGGATDTAILNAVNANMQVQFRHQEGTTAQIYNVYGNMAAVVPLMNNTGAYQGVAIVSVQNVQEVGVGASQQEALRNYQALSSQHGQQIALEKASDEEELKGVVDRIRQDVGPNGSLYLFHLVGVPRIFVGSGQEYVKLSLTQAGDSVVMTYVASGEDEVPIRSFDNLSLPLDKSKMQVEVSAAVATHDVEEGRRESVSDLTHRIGTMSPEELKRLEESLRRK